MSKFGSGRRMKEARIDSDVVVSNKCSSLDSLVDSTVGGFILPGGDINSVPKDDVICEPSTSSLSTYMRSADSNNQQPLPMLALPAPPLASSTEQTLNLDENGHQYVGLVNQAMTCYLNSLLQTLYLTPEFRNAIYNWQYVGSEEAEAKSIPFQLQKLFVLLQTCEQESLETLDLTASFGWSSSEAYEQHDIQEFCRIMFDALKHKWSKTEKSFHDLYRGSMEDFVKCLFCNKENVKEDEFLDLPLAIKQYGATSAFRSVEEALHAFIKPEILEGSNQYHCSQCGEKQNALKGLRIKKFPYLLSIQLKRFDFDYNTLHRIKLNDKMTFPILLNLNEFVYKPNKAEPQKMTWAQAVINAANELKSDSPLDMTHYVLKAEDSDGHINKEEADSLIANDGPYVYELFSVMVHQGSASGGHYFAYIKNMDQDCWFCFNDTSVSAATIEEIQRTFGGCTGGWSSGNTNAYMLMYRQIDRQRNEGFIKTAEFGEHLKRCMTLFEQQELEKLRLKAYRDSLVAVSIVLNNGFWHKVPVGNPQTIKVPYQSKLVNVFKEALDLFTHADRSLLSNKSLVDVFPECDVKNYYRSTAYFMLDAKPAMAREFYTIIDTFGMVTAKLMSIDVETGNFSPIVMMQVHEDETVEMVKCKIGTLWSIPKAEVMKLRLVIDKGGTLSSATMLLLDSDKLTCGKVFGGLVNPLIYTDACASGDYTDEDRIVEFSKSRMFGLLDRPDFKEAGFSPSSEINSGSTTPHRDLIAPCATFSWNDIGLTRPVPTDDKEWLKTIENSTHTSTSSDPEHDNHSMEAEGDIEMSSASEACMRMVSPVVSDNEEHNFNDVPHGVVSNAGQTDEKTSHAEQSIVGSETFISAVTHTDAGAFVVGRIRDENQDEIEVNVDGRYTVQQLKEWLASFLNLDVGHFVLMKHYADDDQGYESVTNDGEQVHTAFYAIKKLSVKLKSPLKENERLLRIARFELDSSDHDSWPTLFSMPVTAETRVRTVLVKCQNLLESIYVSKYDYNQLRLRDLILGQGAPMLKSSDILAQRGQEWNRKLYLQVLPDEELIKINMLDSIAYPVMVCRWKPATLEVSPVVELMVSYDRSDQLAAVKEQIAIHAHVKPDQILLSEALPVNMWTRWPYLKDRIDLLETPFDNGTVPPTGTFNGKLLYYKMTFEASRILTEEEKRSIRIKDNSSKVDDSVTCRRRERPLRIQLSTDNVFT